MSEIKPEKMSLRCPVCFSREIDVVLYKENDAFYCIKCGFSGHESEIRSMYNDIRKKYRLMLKRMTLEDQDLM